jgi:hypothetical protein
MRAENDDSATTTLRPTAELNCLLTVKRTAISGVDMARTVTKPIPTNRKNFFHEWLKKFVVYFLSRSIFSLVNVIAKNGIIYME